MRTGDQRAGGRLVASLLLVAMPFVTSLFFTNNPQAPEEDVMPFSPGFLDMYGGAAASDCSFASSAMRQQPSLTPGGSKKRTSKALNPHHTRELVQHGDWACCFLCFYSSLHHSTPAPSISCMSISTDPMETIPWADPIPWVRHTHTHMKPIDGSMVSLVDVLFSSALWAPCLSLLIGVL